MDFSNRKNENMQWKLCEKCKLRVYLHRFHLCECDIEKFKKNVEECVI